MKRVLVLMSHLSDYMVNCLLRWQQSGQVEIHVVHREVNGNAPFNLEDRSSLVSLLHYYDRASCDRPGLVQLMKEINPDLIICFGWMDSDYLSLVHKRPHGCQSVMTMDNQWLGTLRQHIGVIWSRFRLHPLFDHVWVPGRRQRDFALKLGFPECRIREGLYVANSDNFDPIWHEVREKGPLKRLVFVGRYAQEKGLRVLWQAFESYHERTRSNLELLCVGTGPLEFEKPIHPKIRHLGFVQPSELRNELAGGGIFILPSTFEPWGLVVQEFALAGFPLVLSRYVGASDRLLSVENGLILSKVDKDTVVEAISRVDLFSNSELASMSHASRKSAEDLSVDAWVRQAGAFLKGMPC